MGTGRIRFPRYINEKEEIVEYEDRKSHAYSVLKYIKDGKYADETIVAAYDCPLIKKKTLCKTCFNRKD